MVTLEDTLKSNDQIPSLGPFTAVYAGGTSGIGEYALLELAAKAASPKIYILGRKQESADRIIASLKEINAAGTYIFLQSDLSLIRNVDAVCDQIKQKESKINLLFLTQAKMSFKLREMTSEGLDRMITLQYYSRARFMHNLLPLLANADFGRVVSVFRGGKEGKIFPDDLELKDHYGIRNVANHMAAMNTLIAERYAQEYPSVSLLHIFPGAVLTNFLDDAFAFGFGWLTSVINVGMRRFAISNEESGQRSAFLSTSARFPAAKPKTAGVPLEGYPVVNGIDGKVGSGAYAINYDGENTSDQKLLNELRKSTGDVYDHTMAMFEKALKSKPVQ